MAMLSARGVPGEINSGSVAAGLPSLLEKHGSRVPNFDIFGHQKVSCMFKDKTSFASVAEREAWVQPPGDGGHPTRSALKRFQKVEIVPDISYDLDGDGVVGQRDYFIGKHFDDDRDNKLNAKERKNAVAALGSGWLDRFSFGHDQAGSKRPYPVVQIGGKVLTVDNAEELATIFPPHPDQEKKPAYATKTEMRLGRRAEAANKASGFMEAHNKENPFFLPEQPVMQEYYVQEPLVSSVGERAEAEHQAARVKVGLLPTQTMVNPLREAQVPSLQYEEHPAFGTRSEMRQTRKEKNLVELEEQRLEGEQHYVPYSMRANQRDAAAFEFRRPDPDALTLSKLQAKRRAHRIEYEMRNCPERRVEYPQFSEKKEPWYTLKKGYKVDASGIRELADSRGYVGQSLKRADVTAKVNQTNPPDLTLFKTGTSSQEGDAFRGGAGGGAGQRPHAPMPWQNAGPHEAGDMSGHTMKKWSSEFLDSHNFGGGVCRLFDTVSPAVTLSTDYMPLDNFSSFDVIRATALKKEAERRKRAAMGSGRGSLPYGVDALTQGGGNSRMGSGSDGGGPELSYDFQSLRGGLLGDASKRNEQDRYSEQSSQMSEQERRERQTLLSSGVGGLQGGAAAAGPGSGPGAGAPGARLTNVVTSQAPVVVGSLKEGLGGAGGAGAAASPPERLVRQEATGEDLSMLDRLTAIPKLRLPEAAAAPLQAAPSQQSVAAAAAAAKRRTTSDQALGPTPSITRRPDKNVLPQSARAPLVRSSGFQWVDKVSPRPEASDAGGSKVELASDLGGAGSSRELGQKEQAPPAPGGLTPNNAEGGGKVRKSGKP